MVPTVEVLCRTFFIFRHRVKQLKCVSVLFGGFSYNAAFTSSCHLWNIRVATCTMLWISALNSTFDSFSYLNQNKSHFILSSLQNFMFMFSVCFFSTPPVLLVKLAVSQLHTTFFSFFSFFSYLSV